MENMTGSIPDPVYVNKNGDTIKPVGADSIIPRPNDKIQPNWSRSKHKNYFPSHVIVAMPFTVNNIEFSVGVGMVEYANMNYYYQNNNALSPAINMYRPFPDTVIQSASGKYPVQWYQTMSSRDGVLKGYGGALSVKVTDDFTLGFSGLIIKGSTDDYESNLGRGTLVFLHYYAFRLDTVNYFNSKTGTSDFKGSEFTLSGIYKIDKFKIGFSIKPPSVITRDYTLQYHSDTAGVATNLAISSSDKIKLPWRGMVGLSVPLRRNLDVDLEYEIRPLANATYTLADGTESKPFRTCSELRAGFAFKANSWLTIRGGGREQVEVYEEMGNPLEGQPIRSSIYSGGFGITYEGIHLNLAYEYSRVKYDDILANTVYFNKLTNHNFIADIVYEIPLFK